MAEPTTTALEAEAHELRILSGFKVKIDDARNRIADSWGWNHWEHMLRCKAKRGVS